MDISSYISKDGEYYYFDPTDTITGKKPEHLIEYEDGDTIKWVWNRQKLKGTLKIVSYNIFKIENIKIL
jgi:hypothetical protein